MRIERVVNNESLIELAGQIEQLRADGSALRGEGETLRFETESAGERQRQLYLDIDQRLQALEQSRGASADPRFGADTAGPDGGFGGFSAGGAGGSSTAPASGAQASAGNDHVHYSKAVPRPQAGAYYGAAGYS